MIKYFLLFSLLIHSTSAVTPAPTSPPKKWLTLNGRPPAVIARGGFSGVFPASSDYAIQMALSSSISDVVLLCTLQLTKDGVGICQQDCRIENTTNIQAVFPDLAKTHKVNGQDLTGWFSLDFTYDQLYQDVSLVQNIYTRTDLFDNQLPISRPEDVVKIRPPAFWLHVPYDAFYTENKLSIAKYIQRTSKLAGLTYLSCPEIGFLKEMSTKVNMAKTKLLFSFLDNNLTEPTTKQTYDALLGNLAMIKQFASGIVVPKCYVWPVNEDNYLEAPSNVVTDAHKQGLEVYVYGFANDLMTSFNYSYDPTAEYLQFIDNSQFSVDGLITDFPPTASAAVACFAGYNATKPRTGPLIITHNGASGVYPGSTDLAYQQAIDDGADIIDCSVQMSKDGVAFCLDSADVSRDTTATTTFMSLSTTVPEIQPNPGIFSFDLAWNEIQSLHPELRSPFGASDGFPRNPANENMGKFMALPEFLEFAKAKAVSGILINIENAAYLASKKSLDMVTAVSTALSNATLDKQSTQEVLIQSDDTSVLEKFQNVPAYKRVLSITAEVSDAPIKAVDEIKKFADAVSLTRFSIIPTNNGFTTRVTEVVKGMHKANISAYVSVLMNEYITLAFDYYSDPDVEIVTYVNRVGVDGIITEYPATANRLLSNPCANLNIHTAYSILPAEPGSLLSLVPKQEQPPASAPRPALAVADIDDPPLPGIAKATATATADSSGVLPNIANKSISLVWILVLCLLSMRY